MNFTIWLLYMEMLEHIVNYFKRTSTVTREEMLFFILR